MKLVDTEHSCSAYPSLTISSSRHPLPHHPSNEAHSTPLLLISHATYSQPPTKTFNRHTIPTPDRPVVQTSNGAVRGTHPTPNVARFLGIPYAAPPVSEQRFALPQTPTPWGELDASDFGPPAPQRPYTGVLGSLSPPVPGVPKDGEGREWDMDFLKLNVWAPTSSLPFASTINPPSTSGSTSNPPSASGSSSRLPVLIWIHGGALERGSSSQAGFDGHPFAKDGIIFVSLNYRLGAEGFSAFEPFNLGLEDCAAALRWVHAEIQDFGGDAARITLMGESAGGALVTALLSREDTRPLISGAIVHSAPLAIKPPSGRAAGGIAKGLAIPLTREAFAAYSPEELLKARGEQVGAKGDSPLSGAPLFELALAPGLLSPHITLPHLNIPLLIGTTTEEYRLWFTPSDIAAIGWWKLQAAAWWLNGRAALAALWREYPGASYGEVFGQLVTDMFLRKPADELAKSRFLKGVKTWVYEFAWRSTVRSLRAAHAVELPFVFDALGSVDGLALAGRDAPTGLAEEMHGAWVRFVERGEPGWDGYGEGRMVRVYGDGEGGDEDERETGDEGNGWGRTEEVRRADVLDALPAPAMSPAEWVGREAEVESGERE